MSRGEEIFHQIQKRARTDGLEASKQPPTAEYLTRHALESFLDRLTRTEHGENFVLKGGILLAAYGARRPTKDVDAEAIRSSVTADNIAHILNNIAEVRADDGVEFDLGSLDVQEIREEAEYPGLRVRVNISIGTFSGKVLWDTSTGDPIVPMPKTKTVKVPRVLGDDIEMLGYAPETVLAEKGVTILERDHQHPLARLRRHRPSRADPRRRRRPPARSGAGSRGPPRGRPHTRRLDARRLREDGAAEVGSMATQGRTRRHLRPEPRRTGRRRRRSR